MSATEEWLEDVPRFVEETMDAGLAIARTIFKPKSVMSPLSFMVKKAEVLRRNCVVETLVSGCWEDVRRGLRI